MERDEGNLYVLEGVLMGLLLLGAAYAVSTLQQSSVETVRPRSELERLLGDALTVLGGLDDGNGSALLDLYVTQAVHCALDHVPSTRDCDARRGQNLSLKLESYLPLGAGYAFGIGNGAAVREIYRTPLPQGEAVSVSRTLAFEWNLTFVTSDLSCVDPSMSVDLTLIPIDRAAPAWARWANVTDGAKETGGVAHAQPRWWSAYLPAATRAPEATVRTNVTGNGTMNGSTTYSTCALGVQPGADLRAAWNATSFAPAAPAVPLGGDVAFEAQLEPLAALSGVTVGDARVTLYAPISPSAHAADTWIEAGEVPLTGGSTRTGLWHARGENVYGTHVALLRVPVTINGVEVELRKPALLGVGIATEGGVRVPHDPPYRLTLQAWLPDWG